MPACLDLFLLYMVSYIFSSVCSILQYLPVCITADRAGRERFGECFLRTTMGGLTLLSLIYILWSHLSVHKKLGSVLTQPREVEMLSIGISQLQVSRVAQIQESERKKKIISDPSLASKKFLILVHV